MILFLLFTQTRFFKFWKIEFELFELSEDELDGDKETQEANTSEKKNTSLQLSQDVPPRHPLALNENNPAKRLCLSQNININNNTTIQNQNNNNNDNIIRELMERNAQFQKMMMQQQMDFNKIFLQKLKP